MSKIITSWDDHVNDIDFQLNEIWCNYRHIKLMKETELQFYREELKWSEMESEKEKMILRSMVITKFLETGVSGDLNEECVIKPNLKFVWDRNESDIRIEGERCSTFYSCIDHMSESGLKVFLTIDEYSEMKELRKQLRFVAMQHFISSVYPDENWRVQLFPPPQPWTRDMYGKTAHGRVVTNPESFTQSMRTEKEKNKTETESSTFDGRTEKEKTKTETEYAVYDDIDSEESQSIRDFYPSRRMGKENTETETESSTYESIDSEEPQIVRDIHPSRRSANGRTLTHPESFIYPSRTGKEKSETETESSTYEGRTGKEKSETETESSTYEDLDAVATLRMMSTAPKLPPKLSELTKSHFHNETDA